MISIKPEQEHEIPLEVKEMAANFAYAAAAVTGKKQTEDPPEVPIHAKLDPPEQNIIPKRRPAPPYYIVGRHIEEIGNLTEDLPANIADAMNYCYRAGRKPGTDVCDDLLKAVDHLLREYDRQKRLLLFWRNAHNVV